MYLGWDSEYSNRVIGFYDKAVNSGKGVLLETRAMELLELGTSVTTSVLGNFGVITDTAHFITRGLPLDSITLFTNEPYLNYVSPNPEIQILVEIEEGALVFVKDNLVYFGVMFEEEFTREGQQIFERTLEYLATYTPASIRHSPPFNSHKNEPILRIIQNGDLPPLTTFDLRGRRQNPFQDFRASRKLILSPGP